MMKNEGKKGKRVRLHKVTTLLRKKTIYRKNGRVGLHEVNIVFLKADLDGGRSMRGSPRIQSSHRSHLSRVSLKSPQFCSVATSLLPRDFAKTLDH